MLNRTKGIILIGLALSQPALAENSISADSLSAVRQKSYHLFQSNFATLSKGCGPKYTEFHSSAFYFALGDSQSFYSDYAGILMYVKSDGRNLKRVWCASLAGKTPIKAPSNPNHTLWKVHDRAALGKVTGKLSEYQGPLELFGTIGTQSYTELIDSKGIAHCYQDLGNIAYGNPYFASIICNKTKPHHK